MDREILRDYVDILERRVERGGLTESIAPMEGGERRQYVGDNSLNRLLGVVIAESGYETSEATQRILSPRGTKVPGEVEDEIGRILNYAKGKLASSSPKVGSADSRDDKRREMTA